MSKLLIQAYYQNLDRALTFGKSRNEQSIRNYFWMLLNEYARKWNYEVITELAISGTTGRKVTPDGTVKNLWGLPIGLWESKDEKDDIEAEIDAKIKKGYPLTNILFEDSQTVILIQRGEEVRRISIRNPELLDETLTVFFSFKSEVVREYEDAIEKFKADIPAIVETLRARIDTGRQGNPAFMPALTAFHELCKAEINPDITIEDIREMMIQHVLTSDIFNRIFDDPDFHRHNTIAAELEQLTGILFSREDRRNLLISIEHYYEAINATAASITDHHEKQKFLKVLYENFYKVYNPKAADRLGVVYTPNEIVQFMVRAVNYLLHSHFGKTLADRDVDILDPAAGTGTFICEIIENAIPKTQLDFKFKHEIHANEVAILPYYIANLNIEYTFKQKMGYYTEFPNLCFVDTLDNTGGLVHEGSQQLLFGLTTENSARIRRQNSRKISVIIGNPPYNANQLNENENNKNRLYPVVDGRIRETFIRQSTAQKTKVYDMYARFYRWAMDRLESNGVLALITNRSFIDSRTFDGFRKCIQGEFSHAYIIDTRSDVRTNPKIAGTTHNVFGIQTGVAMMFLIKKEKQEGNCHIGYLSLDDTWRKEIKLDWFKSTQFEKLHFESIHPDEKNNWINLSEDNDWKSLMPIADKNVKLGRGGNAIFQLFSLGVVTNRDEWVYDLDKVNLERKVKYFFEVYNSELDRWSNQTQKTKINDFVNRNIKWTSELEAHLIKGDRLQFSNSKIIHSLYRPFVKRIFYFDKIITHRLYQMPQIFNEGNSNKLIGFLQGERQQFSTFSTSYIPNLAMFSADYAQCLPLYRYSETGERSENITDWALEQFRERYSNPTLTLPVHGEGRVGLNTPFTGRVGEGSESTGESRAGWQVPPQLWAKLKPLAREMRKDQTPAEKIVWAMVRNHQIGGYKFRRQHAIDRFIVDFYCSELGLIIEVDGEIHQFQQEKDQIRQEFLESLGNKVIRFSNDEVFGNPDKVRESIENAINPTRVGSPINKEDIFHYVYAVLHHPAYRKKYELNLKRDFPRIPFYDDFETWAERGKKLMYLHLNYESVQPWPFTRTDISLKRAENPQTSILPVAEEPEALYSRQPKVKVKLRALKDSGKIEIDDITTLSGIPAEAWDYKLGNRSALEWVLDQYKEKKPSDPTIAEKFNTYRFADYKEQVIDLLGRVCTVSVETMKIVAEMGE